MDAGVSWSGGERHCLYLNAGGLDFFDVSGPTGLDRIEDGRAVATWDWNGDGAQDLIFRHRSGPMVRAFVARAAAPALQLRLVGSGGNLDAIGAWLTLELEDGSRLVRYRDAGEGYLAQSSRWVHFGLAGRAAPRRLHVRWPGGEEQSFAVPAPGRFRIRQGGALLEAVASPPAALLPVGGIEGMPDPAHASALLLRVPLTLPPTLRRLTEVRDRAAGEAGVPRIVTLWSGSCLPCLEELQEWHGASRVLRDAGVEVLALGLDRGEEREQALRALEKVFGEGPGTILERAAGPRGGEIFAALADHLRGREDALTLPFTLLIDAQDRVQMVLLGRVEARRVAAYARKWLGPEAPRGAFRSLRGGRWYFRGRRDLPGLARRLDALGLREDASVLMAEHRRFRKR